MSKKFLLLLESQAHYEAYEAQKESLETHELLICCLSVTASNYCQKNRIRYILPEDCYTDEESDHYQGHSELKIKELVKGLNGYYHEKIGAKDDFLFDMGSYHFFILYHFFGALHFRAFFLWKVIEKFGVDRILIPCVPESAKSDRPFPVSLYPNCYLDLCLNSVYRDRVIPIPVDVIAVRQYSTLRMRIRSALGRTLRKFEIFNDYLNYSQSNIAFTFWSLLFGRDRSDILLIGAAGPWKYVFPDSRLTNRVHVISQSDALKLPPSEVRDWFFEWFNWKDDFCGFNVSAMGHYEMARVKILSERFISLHEETLKRLKKQKALIYAVAPYASEQYLLSVAKHLGIPRVCFQHGEMSLYYPGLWNEASELLYVSHYFSFGEQCSIQKTKSSEGVRGFKKAVSIGSPGLDKLKNQSASGGSYILFGSAKFLDYGGGFGSKYRDAALNEVQSLLVDYFERYLELNLGTAFIWKHNQERTVSQPLNAVKKIQIIREEKTFTDLLSAASIVILDRPSTTALEACITNKPIFVLIGKGSWYSLPAQLLRKRAVIAETPEQLCNVIDDYLNKGVYPADVTNREFVRAYGCHLDDGKCSDRAVTELINIIEGA